MQRSALSSRSLISDSLASCLEVRSVTLDRRESWSYVFYCFKTSRSLFRVERSAWKEDVDWVNAVRSSAILLALDCA